MSDMHAGERVFLRLRLVDGIDACLEIEKVQEALTIQAKQIAPLPNLDEALLGLVSYHSRVFWLVDLAKALGLSMLDESTAHYGAVIVHLGGRELMVAVSEVLGILRTLDEPTLCDKQLADRLPMTLQGSVALEHGRVLLLESKRLENFLFDRDLSP